MDTKTLLNKIQQWFHRKTDISVETLVEPPIPAELFNADQMERHGITLALSHKLTQKHAPDILLTSVV